MLNPPSPTRLCSWKHVFDPLRYLHYKEYIDTLQKARVSQIINYILFGMLDIESQEQNSLIWLDS